MVSRSSLPGTHDITVFKSDWSDIFRKGDRFFNQNFSTGYDDYQPDAEPVSVLAVGHPVIDRSELRRILMLKLDHIGDFITAFPAFRRIKKKFPKAKLELFPFM